MKYVKTFESHTSSIVNESRDSIIRSLKDNGGELNNADLLFNSDYTVDNIYDFYETLSKLVNDGIVKESPDKTKMILIEKEVA